MARHRARAEQRVSVERPLRAQGARPGRRGHGRARRAAERDLRDRQPRRGPAHELRTSVGRHAPCAMPKPKRDYDAVELSLNKRMANHWSGRVGYLWSRLYGNYTGLSQGDENGRTSPNVGRSFDYPIMMFDGTGQAAYGLLPTDRTHQFKAQAIYDFTFGLSRGRQLVRRFRHPQDPRGRGDPAEQLPGAVPGPRQRRPHGRSSASSTCSCSSSSSCTTGPAEPERQRDQPLRPEDRDELLPDAAAAGQGMDSSEEEFYAGRVNTQAERIASSRGSRSIRGSCRTAGSRGSARSVSAWPSASSLSVDRRPPGRRQGGRGPSGPRPFSFLGSGLEL